MRVPTGKGLELRSGSADKNLFFTCKYEGNTNHVKLGDSIIPLHPDNTGVSKVDLFIDGSIIEAFVDTKEVLTARSYEQPNSVDVAVRWTGSAKALIAITISDLGRRSAQ